MACAICKVRRPRRFCPGVGGDICTICCGTGREVTVDCPLDCEYLQDARLYEKPALEGVELPNTEVRVTEEFLDEHGELLFFFSKIIVEAALNTPGAVDFDVREALDGLVRTYRTLQSGVVYDSVPTNLLAAQIYRFVQEQLAEYRDEETQHYGMSKTRDSDILRLLAFLQRLELQRNNGRPRGRAFVDMLRSLYPSAPDSEEPPASSLILP